MCSVKKVYSSQQLTLLALCWIARQGHASAFLASAKVLLLSKEREWTVCVIVFYTYSPAGFQM